MSFHDPPDPAPEPEGKPRTSTLRRLSLASTVIVAIVIATVVPGAPAEAAGFEPGDIIYEIAGRDAHNAGDAGRLIRLNLGEEIDVRVRRGQEFVTLTVEPRWSPPEGQGPTGITIYPQCTLVGGYGCVPFTERVADPPWV